MQTASINRGMGDSKYKLFLENGDAPPTLPERGLMLAVLERACRDLSQRVEPFERRDAIRWFNAYFTGQVIEDSDCRYTFCQVIEVLGFGALELQFLAQKVKDAEDFEKERIKKLKIEALN